MIPRNHLKINKNNLIVKSNETSSAKCLKASKYDINEVKMNLVRRTWINNELISI